MHVWFPSSDSEHIFCVCMCCVGVTQQLIDEMRLNPENEMLNDLKSFLADGGDMGCRGSFGETIVSIESRNLYAHLQQRLYHLKQEL